VPNGVHRCVDIPASELLEEGIFWPPSCRKVQLEAIPRATLAGCWARLALAVRLGRHEGLGPKSGRLWGPKALIPTGIESPQHDLGARFDNWEQPIAGLRHVEANMKFKKVIAIIDESRAFVWRVRPCIELLLPPPNTDHFLPASHCILCVPGGLPSALSACHLCLTQYLMSLWI